MHVCRRFGLLIVLLLPVGLLAQDPDNAVKEKQQRLTAVVEHALADIQNLRLPENRAFFYSQAGNLIWTQDRERASLLFQNAADELINAQNLAESKRSANPYNELLNGGNTRQQILNTIAARDATLALDLMVKTRPAAIQRALAGGNEKKTKVSNYYQNDTYLAQNENYLEQTFYRMAAEQNPDRAVKILKESLSKGLSNETYNQLTRLAEKDQAAATDMGSRVIDKLLHAGYMADGQPLYINIQLTQSVLNHQTSEQSGSGQQLKFDGSQIHDLAAKFISAFLSDPRTQPYIGNSIVQIAEKFSPSSVEQLKKETSRLYPQNMPSYIDAAYQKLLSADTPAEQMLAAADKFPIENRRQIYESASNKFIGQGNAQAARAVLSENFTDEARDQALMNFDLQNSYNLIGQGKFAEAERVIDGLPDQQRVSALVNLANGVFGKDPKENKTYAQALLVKASQLTSEKPENSVEMSMLTQVIAGYSNVEPSEAIRIFEGIVPKINELTDAAAVVNGFQANSNVRESEFIMTQGDPFYNYGANPSMMGSFAKFDFDRTMKLIDSFSRQEMQISLRLRLAASGDVMISSLPMQGRSFSGFGRRSDK